MSERAYRVSLVVMGLLALPVVLLAIADLLRRVLA